MGISRLTNNFTGYKMKIKGERYRTIWEKKGDSETIEIIDQRALPHKFVIAQLKTVDDAATAIKDMLVRGAPLIGATAAYGMYIAALEAAKSSNFDEHMRKSAEKLIQTRPTAINLAWACDIQLKVIEASENAESKVEAALRTARKIADDDARQCRQIGEFGSELIEKIAERKKGEPVNILTHCNAGWLATVDYGTATAPIYVAKEKGIDVHVWVDETRPRNQGAQLTAWELAENGVDCSLIVDNAGGHLMLNGMVDMCIVGSDRTTYTGDVANKIGTYLKALAARDCGVPFYVALPSSTIDWTIEDGVADIPIEQRDPEEILYIYGLVDGEIKKALVPAAGTKAVNYAFDVTPRRLVTGLITERGVCKADKEDVFRLFPEKK